MNTKLSVQIYGIKYAITSNEEPAYVRGLASEIDKTVTDLMRSGGMSVNQAFLLACLNYLDGYKKSEEGADNLRRQIAEYAEDAAKSRAELAEAKKELAKLRDKDGKKGQADD